MAARQPQVRQRLVVDREQRGGRAELRRHVRDRCPVGERQRRQSIAGELDEGAHDALPAQHLGHGQHEVRGSAAARERPGQVHADDAGHRLVQRLSQEYGLRLDPAHAVPQHAEAVHHRRVGVGADERVGEGHATGRVRAIRHDGREVLEVHLVDDARARRHDAEVVERGLGPPQQLVALAVSLVFAPDVELERIRQPVAIHLHRVIDDEVGRHEGVDAGRVAPEVRHRVAHRGQVDHGRHAGEVLEQDARRHEGDLGRGGRPGPPRRKRLHVGLGHDAATRVPEHVLQQDLHGHGSPRGLVSQRTKGIQPVVVGEPVAERRARVERIGSNWTRRHGARTSQDRAGGAGTSAPDGSARLGSDGASISPPGSRLRRARGARDASVPVVAGRGGRRGRTTSGYDGATARDGPTASRESASTAVARRGSCTSGGAGAVALAKERSARTWGRGASG